MESVATFTADAIRGVGILVSTIKNIPGVGKIFDFLVKASPIGMLADLGKQARQKKEIAAAQQGAPAELTALSKYSIIQDKVVKNANTLTKLSAQQVKDLKLKTAIEKANLALGKGNEIFNMDAIQLNAALINQTEQLGKATTSSQVLAIANDIARIKIKQDILALDDAIASGDQKAITAATAKLNEDMKILTTLGQQNVKLMDIKSVLDSLLPKDLINLQNLKDALALLGQINLASTGSKNTPAGYSGGTGTVANQAPNNTGFPNYGMQIPSSIAATNLNTELLGGLVSVIGSNLKEYITPNPSGISSGAYDVNITIQTGIGDPNAIADAVNQVLQDAVDRGTLRGGAY